MRGNRRMKRERLGEKGRQWEKRGEEEKVGEN